MAAEDSTAQDKATPEQLEKRYPCNGDPFGVWYCINAERHKWAVNDENGDAFTETISHKTALILSDALKIRHKKNDNGLLLCAEQKKVIADALLIGLESYGEIERVNNELRIAEQNPDIGRLPYSLQPIFPLSSDYPIGVFTVALRYMQQV